MMATEYSWDKNYKACRLQLDFFSLIKFSALLGLCSGIVSVPIALLLLATNENASTSAWLAAAPMVVVGVPIVAVLNGAVAGGIGYPLYQWISRRTRGQTYTGIFVGLEAHDAATRSESDRK